MDKIALDVLLNTLQHDEKNDPWLDLLRVLNITGTANSLQLQAALRAIATDWASATALHALDVDVQIAPEVLRESDRPVGRDEVERIERALAWVLRALFQHAPHLDLGYPPVFWRGGEKHE